MNLNEELREEIRQNARTEYLPSPQQFLELKDVGKKIPKPYNNEMDIKITNKSPLTVYYYIDSESPDTSSMQNFLSQVGKVVDGCISIHLVNIYKQNIRNRNPGFKIKVPNQ